MIENYILEGKYIVEEPDIRKWAIKYLRQERARLLEKAEHINQKLLLEEE